MFQFNDFESLLLLSSLGLSALGAVAGVFSAFVNEDKVKELSKRLVLGIFFSLMAGILVTSMMLDIATSTPKYLLIANSLFSLLFGLWAGGIANRKLDDKQRTEALVNEVMSAETEGEIRSILKEKSA